MAVIEIKWLLVIALATFLVKADVPKPKVADIFAKEWGEITQARNVPLKLGERSKYSITFKYKLSFKKIALKEMFFN